MIAYELESRYLQHETSNLDSLLWPTVVALKLIDVNEADHLELNHKPRST